MKVKFFLIIILAVFLRIYQLDKIPPSLFSDEVDIGYHVFSILKTARDYNGNFLPVHFQSEADFRAPLYIYSSIPTIALFGLNEWGVRLPAAIFGVFSIIGIYFLSKKLINNDKIALIAAFLLTISPWHLHYSRAAFEVTLMMALLVWGTYFFLNGIKKVGYFIISAVFLSLAIYSYSPAKLFIPVFIAGLIIIYKDSLFRLKTSFKVLLIIILIVVNVPMILEIKNGQAGYRFSYTSIFFDPTISKEIDNNRLIDSKKDSTSVGVEADLTSKISHNKLLSFSDAFLKNYLYPYSTNFLFLQGDYIGRHSVGKMGQFYLVEFVTIILGIFYLFKTARRKSIYLLLFWLFTAPIPAALTVGGGGHATRLFLMLTPITVLSSLGIYSLLTNLPGLGRLKKLLLFSLAVLFLVNIYIYFHRYYLHYSAEQERLWHFGFKQAITKSEVLKGNFDKVVLTTTTEPPLLFLLFWTKFDPLTFQKESTEKVNLEGFGSDIHKIGKYYLASLEPNLDKDKINESILPGMLVIANRKDISPDLRREQIKGIKLVDMVEYPSGEVAFYLLTHE